MGKWAANHGDLVKDLGDECPLKERRLEDTETVSTLGLRWLPAADCFVFGVAEFDTSEKISKRSILAEIAKLFDPVGWLAPVIVCAKLILQNLWLQGVGWDDPVSPSLKRAWLAFRQNLPEVETIKISKWFGTLKTSECQLHGFCDASERAYAATVYLVFASDNDSYSTLVTDKSRVAPIKTVSIPKL